MLQIGRSFEGAVVAPVIKPAQIDRIFDTVKKFQVLTPLVVPM